MHALRIASYDVAIDLTGGPATFWSRTEIRFGCGEPGAAAAADLCALNIRQAILNGDALHGPAVSGGRLELPRLRRDNTLVVEAEFSYAASGGAGLLRETGADGSACVYSKAYPGGAPHMFCCFDQADLRAPLALSVRAPAGWSCLANAPLASRLPSAGAALWAFAATRPIAPYLFSMCAGLSAGPAFACQHSDGSPLAVTTHALPPAAASLEAALSAELFRQPLLYYERSLGVRYPDGKWDAGFVPRFVALAFGAPGLVTVRDEVLSPGKPAAYLPIVMAHEMAHGWFGGLVYIRPPEDEWLEEAITTYVSRSAVEARYPDAALWSARTSETLPDHAYARNAEPLKRLETMIGQRAVMGGLGEVIRRRANAAVTKDHLVRAWSLASGQDLRGWAASELGPRIA